MNERFTPSDWLTRLLTNWPSLLTHMILTTPLTHTLLGLSAWFTPVWRFVSASRWQTWAKISGQGNAAPARRFSFSVWERCLEGSALIGPQRLHVWGMHGPTSGSRELCLRGERVTWIIQLWHRRGEHLLPTTVQCVRVCQRRRDVKTSCVAANQWQPLWFEVCLK